MHKSARIFRGRRDGVDIESLPLRRPVRGCSRNLSIGRIGAMKLHGLGVCFAAAIALTSQTAGAQVIRGCPGGQGIQGIDFSRHALICVPISAAVDLPGEAAARSAADAALQTNINTEAASRSGMDATLLDAISAETAARKTADEELPDRLDVTILKGSYAFSGATTCLNSSKGFVDPGNADPEKRNFSPLLEPIGPGVLPTVVAASSQSVQGVRTFDGNGRGNVSGIVHNINYPPLLYFLDSPSLTPFNNAGTANTSTLRGTFSYEVTPEGMLIITDDPSDGEVTTGNPSILHWKVSARNVPKTSAKLAKDLKTISTTHADMGMEILVVTSPDGATVRTNPRICHRERMLLKLKG